MSSPPLYGTRRRTERPTSGVIVPVIAKKVGYDLQPWQKHALDVAGELIEVNGKLRHAYSTVVISVPRRGGKTLLVLAKILASMIAARNQRLWYTAQSRSDAVVTMRDDWKPMIDGSPMKRWVTTRLSNGSEGLILPKANSKTRLFAPTPSALHGQAGDVIFLDEAWVHALARGLELETACRPLMATRPGAQTWILSAAGDVDSTWWSNWLDRGRAAALEDRGTGICHLEWTADSGTDKDDVDYADPVVWIKAHPAVIHPGNPNGLIELQFLQEEFDLDPVAFIRTWLNVMDRKGNASAPVDMATWGKLGTTWKREGTLVLSVDSMPHQSSTSIMVCGEINGTPVVEVLDNRAGDEWVVERVKELSEDYQIYTTAIDSISPASGLIDPLRVAGIDVTTLNLQQVIAAASQFVSACRIAEIRHIPHPLLDTAVAGARRRNIGDGAWCYDRRHSIGADDMPVNVSPVIGAANARWAFPGINTPAGGIG